MNSDCGYVVCVREEFERWRMFILFEYLGHCYYYCMKIVREGLPWCSFRALKDANFSEGFIGR